MSKKKIRDKRHGSGIFPLLLKQTISAAICFITVISMNSADNPKIHGYARALGYALRAETNLDNILSQMRDRLPFFDDSTPDSLPSGGEVTFQ